MAYLYLAYIYVHGIYLAYWEHQAYSDILIIIVIITFLLKVILALLPIQNLRKFYFCEYAQVSPNYKHNWHLQSTLEFQTNLYLHADQRQPYVGKNFERFLI